MRSWKQGTVWAAGFLALGLAAAARAQSGPLAVGGGTPVGGADLWSQVLTTLLFSVLGMVLVIAGFKLFDVVIRFDLEREICEKNNIAASILAGAVILGLCLIVAAVILT